MLRPANATRPSHAAAEAARLRRGFKLGEWLIEPEELRASRDGIVRVVTAEQMHVLLCIVEGKGTFVDRRALRSRIYTDESGCDRRLRAAIRAWHAIFGDSSRHPRYIAANGRDGYSLIASFQPAIRQPIPDRLVSAGLSGSGTPGLRRSIMTHMQHLLGELRRRRVFRVVGSYLVGAWLLLQVAEVTFSPLNLPMWWVPALTILAIIGLPIMIALAWTYEITPDGVVRDSVDVAAGMHLPNSRRLVAPVIVAGVVFMAAITGYAWLESIQQGPHAEPGDGQSVLRRG